MKFKSSDRSPSVVCGSNRLVFLRTFELRLMSVPNWAKKHKGDSGAGASLPGWAAKRTEAEAPELGEVRRCSEILLEMLIKLKLQGKLSAKDVCSLVYWAKGAGLQGAACTLAKDPNLIGGHFSENFDATTVKRLLSD